MSRRIEPDPSVDGELAALVFATGLDLITQLPSCARMPLGRSSLDDASTFSPIPLPTFEPLNLETPTAVSEAIIKCMDDAAFVVVDDLALYVGPLRRAAMTGQREQHHGRV